jgi:hypothetical protein
LVRRRQSRKQFETNLMKVNLGKYSKTSDQRKVNVLIQDFDTWSLDSTLAHIILPALIQLKQSKMGVPTEFVQDVGGADYDSQDSFDFYKETHSESFDIACKRWEDTIDKMIWSFQQLVFNDWETQYYHGTPEFDWVKSVPHIDPVTGKSEDTFTMVDKNPNEHWTDYEGMREHERRIQEGLELFGKYYRHLWD